MRFRSPSGSPPEGSSPTSLDSNTSPGVFRRSAHPFRRNPRTPEGPTPRVKVRVQGFSPSSRLAPPSALRVYFTPQTLFGFAFRGFPSREAAEAHRFRVTVMPLLRWLRTRLLGMAGPPAHQPTTPRCGAGAFGRLHGFHPLESPFRRQMGLVSGRRSLPSWFSSSPRFSPLLAMRRLVAVAPPGRFVLPTLHPVTRMVRRKAALRSVARHNGGVSSLEVAVPS